MAEDNRAGEAKRVERERGRWERKKHKSDTNHYEFVCSICGYDSELDYYSCDHCGSPMERWRGE